jgi:CheY-like chemotaxis protein
MKLRFRVLQTRNRETDIKIIAIRASAFNDDKENLMYQGAETFDRKPFQENELLKEIRQHTGNEYE